MRFRPRQVNPSLLAIVAEGFFSRLSFGLISFALPLYAYRLGLSLTQVGLLYSLNTIVALALKPFMGWAADRYGLKRGLTAAIGLRSFVALLLAFAGAPWQLYAIRFVHGASISLRDPSCDALIAEHGGKKAIASAFAWYTTAKSVAGSFGKALAGILLTLTVANFSLVFMIAFLLSALPLVIVVRYVKKQSKEDEAAVQADSTNGSSRSEPQANAATAVLAVARPSILPFVGLGFLISGPAQMLHGLFPILATEYAGLSEAETGIIYLVSTLVILFAGPAFGWLSDNVSRKLVLTVRSVANICASVVYIVAPNFSGILIGKAVDDLGKAAFRPAWGALMSQVSGYDRRSRAQTMSLMSMGEDAGEIAGPILAGFLWSAWGIPVMLGVRALLAIITEVYAVALNGSLKKLESDDVTSKRMNEKAPVGQAQMPNRRKGVEV